MRGTHQKEAGDKLRELRMIENLLPRITVGTTYHRHMIARAEYLRNLLGVGPYVPTQEQEARLANVTVAVVSAILLILILALIFIPGLKAHAAGVPPQIGYDPARTGHNPPVVVVAPPPTASTAPKPKR